MLNALISSKTRRKLLTLFFLNAKESFYTRQIQKLIIEDYKSVQKELKSLAKNGILNCHNKGNMIFYSVNEKIPIYNELKSLIFKTEGFADILKKKLQGISGIKFAFIYGSVARGEERADSDIDLMVVGEASYDKVVKKIIEIENELQKKINFNFYGINEFLRNFNMKKTFFINVHKDKKIFLIGDEDEFKKAGR